MSLDRSNLASGSLVSAQSASVSKRSTETSEQSFPWVVESIDSLENSMCSRTTSTTYHDLLRQLAVMNVQSSKLKDTNDSLKTEIIDIKEEMSNLNRKYFEKLNEVLMIRKQESSTMEALVSLQDENRTLKEANSASKDKLQAFMSTDLSSQSEIPFLKRNIVDKLTEISTLKSKLSDKEEELNLLRSLNENRVNNKSEPLRR